MPDLNKLKGIMVENGKTYVDGARVIGCSVTSFSAKMNGKSNFTVLEANELRRQYARPRRSVRLRCPSSIPS